MGFLDKLFRKKQTEDNLQNLAETGTIQLEKGDTFISTGDNYGYKIIRPKTTVTIITEQENY
jgi:predicted transcriptional regulator